MKSGLRERRRGWGFDQRARVVNGAIFGLACLVALVIVLLSDFSDPRPLYNGYVRLVMVGVMVTVLFLSVLFLEGKARGGLQLGIVLSLDIHLLMVAWLGTHPVLLEVPQTRWFGLGDDTGDRGEVSNDFEWTEADRPVEQPAYEKPVPAAPTEAPSTVVEREEPPASVPAAKIAGNLAPAVAALSVSPEPEAPEVRQFEPPPKAKEAAELPALPKFERQPATPQLPQIEPPRTAEVPREAPEPKPALTGPGDIAVPRGASFQLAEKPGGISQLTENPDAPPLAPGPIAMLPGPASPPGVARRSETSPEPAESPRFTRARQPGSPALSKEALTPPPVTIDAWVPPQAMETGSGREGLPRGIAVTRIGPARPAGIAPTGSASGPRVALPTGPSSGATVVDALPAGVSAAASGTAGDGPVGPLTLGPGMGSRRRPAAAVVEVDAGPDIEIATLAVPAGPSGASDAKTMPDVRVAVGAPRRAEGDVRIGAGSPGIVGGIGSRFAGGPAGGVAATVGGAAEIRDVIASLPVGTGIAGSIGRRRGLSSGLAPAEEAIGLQAMFKAREGEKKKTAIVEHGGNELTMAAVSRGLGWLSGHQHEDGHWSLNRFYKAKGKTSLSPASYDNDAAATGLALLPFLGDGNTHLAGEHQRTVRQAVQWLVAHQKPDGDLSTLTSGNSHMYAHAIAAIAVCEAYGMSKDQNLRAPAQRAVDFIVAAQTKGLGGWRYQPRNDSDTSVVGWQIMALKSAQMASLQVPKDCLDLVRKWLATVEGKGSERGRFRYQLGREITLPMTAEALLCLQYLGAGRDDPQLQAGATYLAANLPKKDGQTSYYWYYGTQVMYHMQGEFWPKWNNALREVLVNTQRKEGELAGTWDPKDQWENQGGRIYATSLRLLMLEVYYRHLPLYQVLRPEMAVEP